MCSDQDVKDLVAQLAQTQLADGDRFLTLRASGHTFGYLWPRTQTVGLKQLVSEQLALVHERPEVFEVQFTSGAHGWVVAHLERIDRTELAELLYEAWRLTVPESLAAEHPGLPE